jgi:hypothetical protein
MAIPASSPDRKQEHQTRAQEQRHSFGQPVSIRVLQLLRYNFIEGHKQEGAGAGAGAASAWLGWCCVPAGAPAPSCCLTWAAAAAAADGRASIKPRPQAAT